MLAALLVVLAYPDTCAACAVRGQEVVPCPPHAAADRDGVTRESKRLRSKDEAEQLAALEAIAALTRAHENAPSPRVVRALATGLESSLPAVRARAAELLGPPQHATEALRVLLDALDGVDRQLAKDSKELDEKTKIVGETDLKKGLGKLVQSTEEAKVVARRMLERQATKEALVSRLAAYADDRVVAAVVRSEALVPTDGGARALLALEARASIEAALEHLGRWEAGRVPDSEEGRKMHEARGQVLKEGLAALAARRGLPAPEAGGESHAAWSAWWRAHAASFPATLPGVRAPAW